MEDELAPRPGTPAGWYPDPSMSGTQRYWNGTAWTEHAAPLMPPTGSRPTTPTNLVLIIAAGILLAVGAIWVIVDLSQPSDADCAIQRLESARGERASWDVDDACK